MAAIDQLRRITSTVFSRRLAEDGLPAAVRSAAAQSGAEVHVTGTAPWPSLVQSCLFACCTDLLRRVPGPVRIDLRTVDEVAQVEMTTTTPPATDWLAGAREQIEVLDGTVQERDGHVVIRLPLTAVGVPS
jgi:hypothetical protein